jgi:hypothetical protein
MAIDPKELQRLKSLIPDGGYVVKPGRRRIARALVVPVGASLITVRHWIGCIVRKAAQDKAIAQREADAFRLRHASLHFDVRELMTQLQWTIVDNCRSSECATKFDEWRNEILSDLEKTTAGAAEGAEEQEQAAECEAQAEQSSAESAAAEQAAAQEAEGAAAAAASADAEAQAEQEQGAAQAEAEQAGESEPADTAAAGDAAPTE